MSRINRAYFTISNSPGTAGALTVSSAVSGPYRTLGAAQNGLVYDVTIVEGSAWEVRTNCTYTHSGTSLSRGTLEDSSTGSAINFTSAAVVLAVESAAFFGRLDELTSVGYTLVSNSSGTGQSCAALTSTKLSTALNTVESDTYSWWDAANNRFTPTRPGLYLCAGFVTFESAFAVDAVMQVSLRKNTSAVILRGDTVFKRGASNQPAAEINGLFEFNGSTDFVELFVYNGDSVSRSTDSTSAQRVIFSASFFGRK